MVTYKSLIRKYTPAEPTQNTAINLNTYTSSSIEIARHLLNRFYPDETPDHLEVHRQTRAAADTNCPDTENNFQSTEKEVLSTLNDINPNKAPAPDHPTAGISLDFCRTYPLITNMYLYSTDA